MAPKAPPAHPPYVTIITDAIKTLKERTGSSLPAIKKVVGDKYKLPQGWEKVLAQQLKKLSAEGKLVKVRPPARGPARMSPAPAPSCCAPPPGWSRWGGRVLGGLQGGRAALACTQGVARALPGPRGPLFW